MKISEFKTNTDAEKEGVWIEVGAGLRLRVARLGNPSYEAYIRKHGRKHLIQLKTGTLTDDKEVLELTRRAMARHVLVDWENLQDDDGINVEYSVERAEEYLAIKDFMELVFKLSGERELFKQQRDEEDLGN